MSLVIFDFDGTLVDSEKYFLECLAMAIEPFGLQATRKLIEDVRARHPDVLFDELLGPEKGQKALESLKTEGQKLISRVKPFEGIHDMLGELSASGTDIAIWTGRDRRSTEAILQQTNLGDYFKHVVSGSCVAINKPSNEGLIRLVSDFEKERQEVLMVGDHSHDIQPANESGCESVHVRWQERPHKLEEGLVPDQTFDDVFDFSSWIMSRFA